MPYKCYICDSTFSKYDFYENPFTHHCFATPPQKMTVITPEMEKKQEEAMDKFLAKQVKQRERELRKLSKLWKVSIHGHDARFMFVRTYIPLAKYHARTYKEKGGKTIPFHMYLNTTELYYYETKTYGKFNILQFDSTRREPFFDQQLVQAKDRTLATFYVDGFLYHKDTGYYVSPEGWTPPADWGVEDRRERRNKPTD